MPCDHLCNGNISNLTLNTLSDKTNVVENASIFTALA